MEDRVSYKIYYEDTDSLGVVYYANYLKYLERGRTEYVGKLGRDVADWNRDGYYFVVYSVNLKFRRSARLSDIVEVVSSFKMQTAYRGLFLQRIERDGELLVGGEIELVCVGPEQQLREFPAEFANPGKA